METTIRDALPQDAARFLEIYSYYVTETAVSFEYEPPTIAQFQSRMRETAARYPYLAAERGGEIIGYACAHPFVGRRAYDRSAELTIYLDKSYTRTGAGKLLYGELEKRLVRMGITNVYACIGVPETDDEYLTHNSLDFHEHMGFRSVGVFRRCGRKFGRWYDMVWAEKIIAPHSDSPDEVAFGSQSPCVCQQPGV